MKTIKQQEKVQFTCDATKKVIDINEMAIFGCELLVASKEEYREVKDDAWYRANIEMHLSPEIGYEVLKFLLRKYPVLKDSILRDIATPNQKFSDLKIQSV
jgi:hypothetical protein